MAGVPMGEPSQVSALALTPEERKESNERMWQGSELLLVGAEFNDILTNADANETVGEFVRDKIRSIVHDPETAETLCPKYHYINTKRTCLDTNYYETFNLPHVRLVDLRKTPITTVTETGIDTSGEPGVRRHRLRHRVRRDDGRHRLGRHHRPRRRDARRDGGRRGPRRISA